MNESRFDQFIELWVSQLQGVIVQQVPLSELRQLTEWPRSITLIRGNDCMILLDETLPDAKKMRIVLHELIHVAFGKVCCIEDVVNGILLDKPEHDGFKTLLNEEKETLYG